MVLSLANHFDEYTNMLVIPESVTFHVAGSLPANHATTLISRTATMKLALVAVTVACAFAVASAALSGEFKATPLGCVCVVDGSCMMLLRSALTRHRLAAIIGLAAALVQWSVCTASLLEPRSVLWTVWACLFTPRMER